jgi:hypothetical protein
MKSKIGNMKYFLDHRFVHSEFEHSIYQDFHQGEHVRMHNFIYSELLK